MKAYVSSTGSGIDSFSLQDVPRAVGLGVGTVRVGIRACSVNYRDLLVTSGAMGPAGPHGLIPCSDGAGEVLEVAQDVRRVKVGDRVALTFNPDWIGGPFRPSSGAIGRGSPALPGVLREEVVVHQTETVVIPEHLSFEEAATLPCAGVTAWNALCGAAPVYPGMSVVVQGGGGVSVFALQFAKLFGARVIAISSSPQRCKLLEGLGADETIDYRQVPDWHKRVKELTGGVGADLTLDVGGAATVERSLLATRYGGRVALIGLLTGRPDTASSLFSSGVDITPIKVGSRDDFELMLRAMAFHRVHPQIASRYALDQFPQALAELKEGRHFGKIVITIAG